MKVPYLLKHNFLSDLKFSQVMSELNNISSLPDVLTNNEATHGGGDPNFASRYAIWMNQIYTERMYSHIWKLSFEESLLEYGQLSPQGRYVRDVNIQEYSAPLVSYYGTGGCYRRHHDMSFFTALLWLCNPPQLFEGGDFILHDSGETIPFSNNTLLIMPGWADHEVTPVTIKEYNDSPPGRFCISFFFVPEPKYRE